MTEAMKALLREVEQALLDAVCNLAPDDGDLEPRGYVACKATLVKVRHVLAESPGTVDSPLIG